MEKLENSTFVKFLQELSTKSKEVTIDHHNCHVVKKATGIRIKNSTLNLNEGAHKSRPFSEILR